ncbi:NACHT domain-containing protein [Micromonospora sp. DT15]|uniref:NACHT domain-containing protein n=1 Tax=Micromonospora sp. DT15 TaxID=3393445 RepID=UPI003CF9D03A
MRREPALTFAGALRVLGRHEPLMIQRISDCTGGIILAAGLGAGLTVAGVPAMAAAASLAPIWGWIDQKNEAILILRKIAKGFVGRLDNERGQERRPLIAAAHTTIVVAAFFEVFERYVGKEILASLELTEKEKQMLVVGRGRPFRETFTERLYDAEIPAPSPSRGYEENIPEVEKWLALLADRAQQFFEGLEAWQKLVGQSLQPIIPQAIERYRSHYMELAASVPEFFIWATLGEHAATRTVIGTLNSGLVASLDEQRDALGRLGSLLKLVSSSAACVDLRAAMERANVGVLAQPIVPADAERYETDVTFPSIGKIFILPDYRVCRVGAEARPADESWWANQPSHDDLDVVLAAHLLAPEATRIPLLILGHPGAGKSMLTKVFAAQMPASDYTVVRVPLRTVGANSPILDQIQQALDQSTNRRVEWARLSDQSGDSVRVILLDGLDELLQASKSDRSGYLQEVTSFQQVEADQGRPVIVIVTSRTVVVERVDMPPGTTVVKLDDFNEAQIAVWLNAWREANLTAIEDGRVRELALGTALRQPELARQPLLLLMLALYAADPLAPEVDEGLSTTLLYQRLLDNFARREVAKKSVRLHPRDFEIAVEQQLRRLAIAALGMFNRGTQRITEVQLGSDLAALGEHTEQLVRPDEVGQRLLGEFFFVHAAEATILGAGDRTSADDRSVAVSAGRYRAERSYEFLHATFGEYLVARQVIDLLMDVAEAALGGKRGRREPEDDLLFALLSHQVLSVRRSTLAFAADLFETLEGEDRDDVLQLLQLLFGAFRQRRDSVKYVNYRPVQPDSVRRLAAYSANLVLLRVALPKDSITLPITDLFDGEGRTASWRSTVNLWRSGLDADGWHSVLGTLKFGSGRVGVREYSDENVLAGSPDLGYADLLGDRRLMRTTRYGVALREGRAFFDGRDWADAMLSWIFPVCAGVVTVNYFWDPPPPKVGEEDLREVAEALMRLFRVSARSANPEALVNLLNLFFSLPLPSSIDGFAFTVLVCEKPELITEVPELSDPSLYDDVEFVELMIRSAAAAKEGRAVAALARLADAINARRISENVAAVEFPENVLPLVHQLTREISFDWERSFASFGRRFNHRVEFELED